MIIILQVTPEREKFKYSSPFTTFQSVKEVTPEKVKMKAYYENKTPGYFDLKYKLYIPMDLKRYGIPTPYGKQYSHYHDNDWSAIYSKPSTKEKPEKTPRWKASMNYLRIDWD